MTKTRVKVFSAFTIVLSFALAIVSSPSKGVQADAVKTQQGISIKSTSLVTNKRIVVPKKSVLSVGSNGSSNVIGSVSRGSANDYSNSGSGSTVVSFAYSLLGRPYVWGASGPNAFDCSGLAMYVYSHFGVGLPHYTGSQFSMGMSVSKSNLQPGDLVFFNTYGSVSHVGIYIGGGNFIHAPGTGKSVTISNLNDGYFLNAYCGARRYMK